MKLPSIEYLMINARNAFLRFPLTIISSLISVGIGVYMTERYEDISNLFPYINVMLCTSLGVPLYFCVVVFSNKKGFGKLINLLITLLATAVLIGIFFTLPNSESTHNTAMPYIRYGIYSITAHLLVSFIPFVFNRQLNGFWHYNKILFIRFLTSVLYSGVLYMGLITALASLKVLFEIKLHEELFFEFFIVIGGFFNTWFFISGIPDDLNHLEEIDEYPKGLKIFTQYILLPLIGLYMLILYAYGIQILALWNWPKGIVSYLITCMSAVGALTFLLLYPYGNLEGNLWIRKVSKGYYYALFPLIAILFIAILMRVDDYGLTINRYAIVTLGVWLLIVATYTVLGKINIKFIPISLAIILILISFGPWGMFSVSERNQVARLKKILEEGKILKLNKVNNEVVWMRDSLPHFYSTSEETNEGYLSDSLHNEVKSILDYLDDYHGFSSIRDLYHQNIDSMISLSNVNKKKYEKENEADIYMKTLGLEYKYIYPKGGRNFSYYAFNENVKKLEKYDYMVEFDHYHNAKDTSNFSFMIDSVEYELNCSFKMNGKLVFKNKYESITIEMDTLIQRLINEYGNNYETQIPVSKMQLYKPGKKYDLKLAFQSIELSDSSMVRSLSGNLLIREKK